MFSKVHVVKDATRGATLEVVVSRMKAVHSFRTSQNPEAGLSRRFVAVSATIPNVSDVRIPGRHSPPHLQATDSPLNCVNHFLQDNSSISIYLLDSRVAVK